MNPNFLENADLEAAWLGDLMKACTKSGAIPAIQFQRFDESRGHNTDHVHSRWWGRTFWWVNGKCKGLSGGRLEEPEYGFFGAVSAGFGNDIQRIVNHLRVWAPSVLRVEGVGEILERGELARKISTRCFPQEDDEWLSIDDAAVRYGRSWQTIRNWVKAGTVEHVGVGKDARIKDSSLRFRIDAIQSGLRERLDSANQSRR